MGLEFGGSMAGGVDIWDNEMVEPFDDGSSVGTSAVVGGVLRSCMVEMLDADSGVDTNALELFVGSGFVFTTSGSVRRRRLRGHQPRSLIAFWLPFFRPKDFGHTLLHKGKISLFCNSGSNPILVRNNTNLAFSLTHSTFHEPFCSRESPTCHLCVPFGKPIQKVHGFSFLLMYRRKGTCNRESWASNRAKGLKVDVR